MTLAVVALVVLSGCSFVTGDGPLHHTAEPTVVCGDVLSETGYSLDTAEWDNRTREAEVGGQSREVRLDSALRTYVRQPPDGEASTPTGGVAVLSTPRAELAGESLNPASSWSSQRTVEELADSLDQYGTLTNLSESTSRDWQLLDTGTTVVEFDATGESDGESTPVTVYVARVNDGGDLVVAAAVHERGDDAERDRIERLFGCLERGGETGPATGTDGTPEDTVASPDDDAAVTLEDGGVYFVGQTVQRDDGVSAGEAVTLSDAEGFVSDVPADSSGVVTLDTSRLSPGQYSLEGEDGSTVASFQLVEQTFGTFAFDSGTVKNEGSDTTATLSVETNRRPTVHYMTATVDGNAVDSSTLQSALGQGTAVDTDGDGSADVVRVEGTNSDSFTLDASGLPTGELILTTDVPDTTASASATITVEGAAGGSASLESKTMSVSQGDVLEMAITLQNTDTASVEFGSEDVGYHVTMDVEDGDGDGEVTVRWDTGVAGNTDDESAAFEAAGSGDSVTNVERTTDQFSGDVALESYSVSVSVDGTETDLGLVTVSDSE